MYRVEPDSTLRVIPPCYARKLARPYHGPFHVVSLTQSNAQIHRVDRPQDEPILVASGHLRRCPSEVPDTFWPPAKKRRTHSGPQVSAKEGQPGTAEEGEASLPTCTSSVPDSPLPESTVDQPASQPAISQQVGWLLVASSEDD